MGTQKKRAFINQCSLKDLPYGVRFSVDRKNFKFFRYPTIPNNKGVMLAYCHVSGTKYLQMFSVDTIVFYKQKKFL